MRTLLHTLAGLPAQIVGFIIVSLLALSILVTFSGVSVHDREMRSLIGERDERATRIAAITLTERLLHHLEMLQSISTWNTDLILSNHILTDVPLLQSVFDYGLLLVDDQNTILWRWQPRESWNWVPQDSGTITLFRRGEDPYFVVSHPLGETGQTLVGAFSMHSLDIPELFSPLRSGTSTEVLLVAPDEQLIFRSGPADRDYTTATQRSIDRALNGESGALYVTHTGGTQLIVTFSPIDLAGWALIVTEPWEELTTATLRLSENTPFILLPPAFISILALTLGVWRIVRPLQRLEASASRLAWGDYDAIQSPVGGIAEIKDLQAALVRMAQRVKQAEHARQSYIGALTQGQENERTRLARELHDETVQTLIVLGQQIQLIERQYKENPLAAQERLRELRQMVNQMLDEVRRLIRNMRPTYLEDLGLVPALRTLCDDTDRDSSLSVSFAYIGTSDRLPPDIEVALYRITQEALANVLRHAAASHVHVTLEVGTDIVLRIEDDGCGFSVPSHPSELATDGHYGLMTMAERIRLVGGTLDIQSAHGKGTQITARIRQADAFSRSALHNSSS